MITKVITFIDERRKENEGKFASAEYFREFLFKDLKKEFGSKVENINIRIDQKVGQSKNMKAAADYLKKTEQELPSESDTCTVKEAMEILGIAYRRGIDIPVKKGIIKKVGKRGVEVLLDRQSVLDHKESMRRAEFKQEQKKDGARIVIQGPGLKDVDIEANDPQKILDDSDDQEDEEDEY